MVNNCINANCINKANNYLSLQIIENKKDHDIHANRNQGPGLGQAQKVRDNNNKP